MSSMAFEDPKGADAAPSKAKKASEARTAIALQFPPVSADPSSALKHIQEETTAYAVVAKACLQLTHFAGSGSCVQIEDTSTVASSALFHDPSYANIMSSSFAALMHCIANHQDRRCRILACKTLAILARSAYARIRPSPLLFSMRDATISRLEDEIGNEVPVALVTAVLEDADDGVSASAMEALGLMTLSSSQTVGTLVEDELLREMESIALCRIAPYAPTLRAVVDEDPSIPQAELQTRIYENIVSPRLLHIVDRILRYVATNHVAIVLPCLTACLVHQVQTTPSLVFGMDRPTFAKRWVELDAAGLVDAVVQSCILPALQSMADSQLAYTAALSGLRLANACPQALWVPNVGQWAAVVLKNQVEHLPLESKLATLAALVIALRVVPLHERTAKLMDMAEDVASLPSTSLAPAGITSPGILTGFQGSKAYRRPARVGLWAEIALSFFIDGPVDQEISRADSLRTFLSSAVVKKIMSGSESKSGIVVCRDEILLVFCLVAVDTGRRFRVAADGTLLATDPNAPQVGEWIKLAWTVLTTFVPCVNMGPKLAYMEEDLSLLTAGQTTYVKLLQEYLHLIGLLNPESSVALKLAANACPPHLLWDQLGESASLLAKFEMFDMAEDLEATTKLIDELVIREVKQGMPSHHMRLYVLSLASDHWIQGRVVGIRKQFEATTTSGASSLTLNMQSARQILMALSPKRLLAKILESHVPPVDAEGKKKKDPIKKLGFETVRVCVACIENVALMACDWRRRFGASQESKHIVSVAVGLLQGKGDETPADDMMRSLMGPLCEAALNRIQAYYKDEGSVGLDQPFKVSELVLQPVRMKIKPLVSSSKPPSMTKDEYIRGYLMQVSRQFVSARIEQAVRSSPPADSLFSSARPKTWLRLSVPPLPESKDARYLGNFAGPLAAWGNSVNAASASSDPTAIVLAYTPRRCLRYDGEDEFRLQILMRVYNMTAIEFTEGIRLELGVVQATDPSDSKDSFSVELIESLGGELSELSNSDKPLMSSDVVYKQELKAGEYITWEVALNHIPPSPGVMLMPSIVFRNVEVESDEAGAKWVGDKDGAGDASTAGGESKGADDGFQVTTSDNAAMSRSDATESDNVCVPGEAMLISPMVGLQPCPLVFFRDRWGDVDAFRFLWFRMPYQLAPIKIVSASSESKSSHDETASKIAAMSSITWEGEAIPGGFATRLWAFASLSGDRVLCVLAESDNGETKSTSLHFRGDNQSLMFALVSSKSTRGAVVSALMPSAELA